MKRDRPRSLAIKTYLLSAVCLLAISGLPERDGPGTVGSPAADSYIVQSSSADAANAAVRDAGGTVTARLGIINAVGAILTSRQLDRLLARNGPITVYPDADLEVSGSALPTVYPTLVGAADLHDQGIRGDDVTIAVLDTGLWIRDATRLSADGRERIVARHDVLRWFHSDDDSDDESHDQNVADWNGHGTHVTSIMVSSRQSADGRFQGVAPNANVVAVRAFSPDGSGSYIDILTALDWIVTNRSRFDIRILNLSFSAAPFSFYWDDPVNQAVMAAWQAGIAVVVSAGNSGPNPMSIGVPGNVPYVITVGAMTDNYTPAIGDDDRLATFSAAGPTIEGFVKPDLVAPGGHMLAMMPPYSWQVLDRPEFMDADGEHYTMSGTSQAAAVVSGILALMMQADPSLTPDQAKCRLTASARAAALNDETIAYSMFQQGAGLVDANAAILETAGDCANRGLDISRDLGGLEHYQGPARIDAAGNYYVVDPYGNQVIVGGPTWNEDMFDSQGALWPEGALWNQGSLWPEGALWNQGSLWPQGALWPQGSLWPQGALWPQSRYLWDPLMRRTTINLWVTPE